jgi:hypothetical protein
MCISAIAFWVAMGGGVVGGANSQSLKIPIEKITNANP